MNKFVENLLSNNLVESKIELEGKLKELVSERMNQFKMRVTAQMYEEIGFELDLIPNTLGEANITRMGRTKLVRVRIRGGKVQRRKKVSAVKGYTIRGGKMVRMSAQERMHRKRAARKSKFKRRAKLRQALRKRKMSLRRRAAMGL